MGGLNAALGGVLNYFVQGNGVDNQTYNQTWALQQHLWDQYRVGQGQPGQHIEFVQRRVPDTYHIERRRRLAALKTKLAFRKEAREEGVVINSFQIGCDPEFVALGADGRLISAAALDTAEIGHDHNGRVVELRPAPAKGAFALVKRLQGLINNDRLKTLHGVAKFRAGAHPIAGTVVGGHIHVDVSPYAEGTMDFNTAHVSRVRAMDTVTRLLEHLDILPKTECNLRRRNTQYGHFGDVRVKLNKDGRKYHTEYRTMASWLYDPKVAFLCLTAAKIAAADPVGTFDALTRITSFSGLISWLERYKNKDANASRVLERIPDQKAVTVDPDVDFRERWERLGL